MLIEIVVNGWYHENIRKEHSHFRLGVRHSPKVTVHTARAWRKIDLEEVQYCNMVIYQFYTLWRKKSASDRPQWKRGLNKTNKSVLSLNVSSELKRNSSARKIFIPVHQKISHLHLNRRSSSSTPYSSSWLEKKKAAGQVNLFRITFNII
jgi:hypothetical protein